jgi:hypothetical protein
MPCTPTDPAESQGNVRDRRLSDIWANGFAAFRSKGHGIQSDCSDCWLQTRNGTSCRPAFFSDVLADGTHLPVGPVLQIGLRKEVAV